MEKGQGLGMVHGYMDKAIKGGRSSDLRLCSELYLQVCSLLTSVEGPKLIQASIYLVIYSNQSAHAHLPSPRPLFESFTMRRRSFC